MNIGIILFLAFTVALLVFLMLGLLLVNMVPPPPPAPLLPTHHIPIQKRPFLQNSRQYRMQTLINVGL
jgi:hypothetical protein